MNDLGRAARLAAAEKAVIEAATAEQLAEDAYDALYDRPPSEQGCNWRDCGEAVKLVRVSRRAAVAALLALRAEDEGRGGE